MQRFAAEALQRDLERAVVSAAKNSKTPWMDIAADFELSFEEFDAILKKHGMGGPPRKKDDLRDARDEPKRGRR